MRLFVLSLLLLVQVFGMRAPKDPTEAVDWYQRMVAGVKKWATFPDKEKGIHELGDYVFKFGGKMPNHSDQRWHDVYFLAQSALLSIPGHAEYFERKRAELRVASEDFLRDTDYHRFCAIMEETLVHLPSPETVRVSGLLMERTDDMYTEEQYQWLLREFLRESDVKWIVPAFKGAKILLKIGLRGLPEGSGPKGEFRTNDIDRMRAWWAEVKAGERAFSFEGQNVEYRFNPDGTWEETKLENPPDDGPGSRAEAAGERPRGAASPRSDGEEGDEVSRLPWIVAGGIGLLVLAFLGKMVLGKGGAANERK